MGRSRREEEAKPVFMQKKAGKLPCQEGLDCSFAAGLPGVNPSDKRPSDPGEKRLGNCSVRKVRIAFLQQTHRHSVGQAPNRRW